ncbi:MAG: YeeE/YedE family protein [Nitrosomonadales bacterium]|nr:YeeE/YedE family protein [Nitrosomonadales bacterium]
MQRVYLVIAAPLTFFLAYLGINNGLGMPLVLLGVLLGLAFHHAEFGFTRAYRRMMEAREVRLVQAQLLLLAVTTLLFSPLMAMGSFHGESIVGAIAPVSVGVAVGAFLFGIGMQLSGGCGSGTLCGFGSGNSRLFFTVITFCFGGWFATLHATQWEALPAWNAPALGETLGWPQAVTLQLMIFASLWWTTKRWGTDNALPVSQTFTLLRGPWPLFVTMLLVALLNLGVLIETGHPWSVTWAFTLWGAKMAMWLGWDATSSVFWNNDYRLAMLDSSVFADETSVMDMAIILGSVIAASLAGKLHPNLRVAWLPLLGALLGGLLMGYGSRIAYGCNIGAFLSGVASTSLHGWLWIIAALPGNWLGIHLRKVFRIE